jgi:hypothetical protein
MRSKTLAVLFLFLVSIVGLAQTKKPLTNNDIFRMEKAGFADQTIIGAIRANDTAFDTSVDGLMALKAAGVTQPVIDAMLSADAAKQASTGPSQQTGALSAREHSSSSGSADTLLQQAADFEHQADQAAAKAQDLERRAQSSASGPLADILRTKCSIQAKQWRDKERVFRQHALQLRAQATATQGPGTNKLPAGPSALTSASIDMNAASAGGLQLTRDWTRDTPFPLRPGISLDVLRTDEIWMGGQYGLGSANALGGNSAVFSAAKSSRIEYGEYISEEGTLEMWIKVNHGYHYDNYQLQDNQDWAIVFSSDSVGGDVPWPGATKLIVKANGDLTLRMENAKNTQPSALETVARATDFRFGEWHSIGISYGSEGQWIMLDGKLVAGSPSFKQKLGRAGNHQEPLDEATIGETVSHFWAHHRYEGGFDGVLAGVRLSKRQRDWALALGSPRESGDGRVPAASLAGTILIASDHGPIRVANFYKYAKPVGNGSFLLEKTRTYALSYGKEMTCIFDDGQHEGCFGIDLTEAAVKEDEIAAQKRLMRLLGVPLSEFCKLTVGVTPPPPSNPDVTTGSVRPSLCPNGRSLFN